MIVDNKYYSIFSNLDAFDSFRSVVISSLNGEVAVSIAIENYAPEYEKVLDIVEFHFKFYFDRQFFDNPLNAIRDSIIYVGRQIYLEAKHNEVLFGASLSIFVSLLREREFYFSQIGQLGIRQIINSSTSDNCEFKNLVGYTLDKSFVEMNNFHEINPHSFKVLAADSDSYMVTNEANFSSLEFSNRIAKLFNDKEYFDENHPFSLLKFKYVASFKHEDDNSVITRIANLEYFKNIPSSHIGIIAVVILVLVAIMLIFNPEDKIQTIETKVLLGVDSIIEREANLLIRELDSLEFKNDDKVIISMRADILEPQPTTRKDTVTNYTIQKQDNLYRISKTFNISLNRIIETNNLPNNTIHPGDEIIIPIRKIHVVEKSETLYEISIKYEISVQQLMQCNSLDDVAISDGIKLVIPYLDEN